MKYMTLAILCCSVFLSACDKGNDTNAAGEGKGSLLDKANSLAKDVTEKTGESLNEAIDSTVEATKDAAENVVASTKEKAGEVMDAAKESVTETVNSTVTSVKDVSSDVVDKVTEKTDEVVAAVSTTTAVDTNEGETLFKNNCFACHGAGIAGSPKLGDKAAWDARVAQGNAVLIEHAIKGFRGEKGYYMPPKGGAMHLNDDQIAQVVEYMVAMVQ